MFKKRYVEIEVKAVDLPAKEAGRELTDDAPATFELVDKIEVDKIRVTKKGNKITLEVGTDNGHYLAVRVK